MFICYMLRLDDIVIENATLSSYVDTPCFLIHCFHSKEYIFIGQLHINYLQRIYTGV